jgi:putative Ca2+/H+ antiporter (TMEM165/GDT1 family)
LVCEIGDKTFFLGMIMAMKYNKLVVFTGAFLALAVMTILSAIGGKVVFSFLPKIYTDIIVTLLFFYFGIKLIYEAYTEEEEEGENEELK